MRKHVFYMSNATPGNLFTAKLSLFTDTTWSVDSASRPCMGKDGGKKNIDQVVLAAYS